MNLPLLLTHALVFAAAWLLIATCNKGLTEHEPRDASPSGPLPSKSGSPARLGGPSGPSPKDLLTALATTPMEAHERRRLKKIILREWGQNDPLGLLTHFENRPWPAADNPFGPQGMQSAFEELARNQPEELLAWARRNGSRGALHSLTTNGHPPDVLALLLAQDPGTLPLSCFASLFAEGQRLIPDFHRHLTRLDDPASRREAFDGIADTLIDTKRFDDYFATIHEFATDLDPATVGKQFASMMAKSNLDPALLEHLPTAARNHAIEALLAEPVDEPFGGSATSASFRRDFLAHLVANDRLNAGNLEQAIAVMESEAGAFSHDGSDQREARAWKEWALALPASEFQLPLQESAIRRWARHNADELHSIPDLPTVRLRDVAYTISIGHVDPDTEPGRLEAIVQLIEDPDLRAQASRAARRLRTATASEREDPFFDPFEE